MRPFGLTCLLLLVLLALLLLIPACGKVFINASWTGGTITASGMVSIVQLTIVDSSTQVTIVTLVNDSASTIEKFCGDQRPQFPVNDFVVATFTPGQPCSSLFSVQITVN